MGNDNLEFAIVTSLYLHRRVRVACHERIALVIKVVVYFMGDVWLICQYPGKEWSFEVKWQECTVLEDHSQ